MQLTRSEIGQLYIATVAAVTAKFAKNDKASAAQGVAHLAHSYADASVMETKIRARVERQKLSNR